MSEKELILACRQNDRRAQNVLFHQYAPMMLGICMRYIRQKEIAEDILVSAFFKIFTKIESYKESGSFEGWMKRIVINECLMEIRRRKSQYLTVSLEDSFKEPLVEWQDDLEFEEILQLLDELPDGYRTVFNMYVLEGYKHKEIAEKLGISINTSKSQLILARRRLQALIKKKYDIRISA